ncbi:hypothetical protein [Varunaivibrio sulfuroxidans]|uniref:Uncharacterized protein n=1 Tax=Varunaivibrio sulfuroxidans TaxID=1773489 RepID=A0A4R3J4W3_9PROT|nr:hypothetical protein [Varunaivibrio sulfuroxidans]TCS60848.1 hypothetical protein EDD55_1098 [Varunaivibrio sulfuroxidans]WES31738.1 hypothetical protein P3M64_05045 [Varunaivibrio sulfuroxidans]
MILPRLISNFSKLMPPVDFQDIKRGSVCQSAPIYEQTPRLDPKKLQGETWDQRNVTVKVVQARRETLLTDGATKGLTLQLGVPVEGLVPLPSLDKNHQTPF